MTRALAGNGLFGVIHDHYPAGSCISFAAALLLLIAVIAVGYLAVPILTTGAAYDSSQTLGWKHEPYKNPEEAKKFYAAITVISLVAMSINFIGLNPMKVPVWAGIVQGFSTPSPDTPDHANAITGPS